MNHGAIEVACGHSLGQRGDLGQRTRDRPADDDGSERRQYHRKARYNSDEPGGRRNTLIDIVIDALGTLGIQLAELGEVRVERLAHAPVGVVVSPFTTCRR